MGVIFQPVFVIADSGRSFRTGSYGQPQALSGDSPLTVPDVRPQQREQRLHCRVVRAPTLPVEPVGSWRRSAPRIGVTENWDSRSECTTVPSCASTPASGLARRPEQGRAHRASMTWAMIPTLTQAGIRLKASRNIGSARHRGIVPHPALADLDAARRFM
jgi:hypothetical protein